MPKESLHISTEHSYTGALILSAIHKGARIQQTYYNYGPEAAKKLFKKHLKTLK